MRATGEGNGRGSKLPPPSPYCLYAAAAPRGGVITNRNGNEDLGERKCCPFLGRRTRHVVVLNSWCVTEQNRSPPTFAGAQTRVCVQASRLPACRGPGPGDNDDWLSLAGRTEATGANKACGQRIAEAIERSRVLGQGRYTLQPEPELGLIVKYRKLDAGCSTRWSVGKWGGALPKTHSTHGNS